MRVTDRQVAPEAQRPEAVLARVAKVAGVAAHQLRDPGSGRRGNPARRLAAWALERDTDLTQVQIGQLLGMSPEQVAVTLGRLRGGQPGPVGALDRHLGAGALAW